MTKARQLDLYEGVCMMASRMPRDLPFTEPDDDWSPVAFLEDADGGRPPPIPMHEFMNDIGNKNALAYIALPALIRMAEAVRVVMVLSVWTLTLEKDQPMDVLPSESPDREEKLMVIELTAQGVQRSAYAPILRDDVNPPTLGDWEDSADIKGYAGRFVDPIIKALKTQKGVT